MKNTARKRLLSFAVAAALCLCLASGAYAAPPGGGPGGPGGGSGSSVTWTGAAEITASASQENQTYASATADENALLVNTTGSVALTNPTVTKSGDSGSGDNCNFYGINSGVMVKGGGTTTITGGTISTTARGANGVFSYGGNGGRNGAAGDGTTVHISDTVITTTNGNAGGIMTTGGGVTVAENLTITTYGQSSAPIRTDRGGGTVTVTGGTYTSNGLGSPAIYSTADITVSNATLVSNLSEGVCIEGKNSVTLRDCDMTVSNTKRNGNAKFLDSVMIYQSMSGDAASGTSSFTMTGGSLTSKSGHVFHVTNTNAVITLSGVSIVNTDAAGILLSVCADGWSGASNIAALNASGQTLEGGVLVGSDSTLTMTLSDGSVFTGYVGGSITNAAGTAVSTSAGTVNVTLDDSSRWNLTADSYITAFTGDAANVVNNGYTLYVNGTALDGTSDSDDSGDPSVPTSAAGSWYLNAAGWWFRYDDGGYPADAWEYINGSWYYFDTDGYMLTGWIYDGAWYYLGESGAMLTGWIYDGAWYYLDETGAMLTGWIYDGAWYYLSETGAMLTGWIYDGAWYYLDETGAMLTGWIYGGGVWYYFRNDGAMTTGWMQLDGVWYYFKASGAMAQSETLAGYTFADSGAWVG